MSQCSMSSITVYKDSFSQYVSHSPTYLTRQALIQGLSKDCVWQCTDKWSQVLTIIYTIVSNISKIRMDQNLPEECCLQSPLFISHPSFSTHPLALILFLYLKQFANQWASAVWVCFILNSGNNKSRKSFLGPSLWL